MRSHEQSINLPGISNIWDHKVYEDYGRDLEVKLHDGYILRSPWIVVDCMPGRTVISGKGFTRLHHFSSEAESGFKRSEADLKAVTAAVVCNSATPGTVASEYGTETNRWTVERET